MKPWMLPSMAHCCAAAPPRRSSSGKPNMVAAFLEAGRVHGQKCGGLSNGRDKARQGISEGARSLRDRSLERSSDRRIFRMSSRKDVGVSPLFETADFPSGCL
eukprot:scaffold5010_cov215-Pinguiococcus_pyrenoidosus.AAC.2